MLNIDFSFRELEVFCKVVELESFSKAAEAVFLVQASVSERIASLENKVGARLLDRLGRKVIPTAAGELFHKHATLLLEMKETAQLEIEKFMGTKNRERFSWAAAPFPENISFQISLADSTKSTRIYQ